MAENNIYGQLKNMLQSNGSVYIGYMDSDEIEYYMNKLRSENIECSFDEDTGRIVTEQIQNM